MKKSNEHVEPQKTDADVDIQMIVEESLLKEFSEQVSADATNETPKENAEASPNAKVAEAVTSDEANSASTGA